MNEFYNYPVRPDEIYHFGIKRRSGRYPYGSGERPYQGEDVRRLKSQVKDEKASKKTKALSEKNLEIGKRRLENRIRVANVDVDRYSREIGWKKTEKAAEANKRMSEIKKATNEILADEERTRMLGHYTRKVRNRIVTASAIGSVASFGTTAAFIAATLGTGSAALLLTPIAPIAVGTAGYKYYQHTKY